MTYPSSFSAFCSAVGLDDSTAALCCRFPLAKEETDKMYKLLNKSKRNLLPSAKKLKILLFTFWCFSYLLHTICKRNICAVASAAKYILTPLPT